MRAISLRRKIWLDKKCRQGHERNRIKRIRRILYLAHKNRPLEYKSEQKKVTLYGRGKTQQALLDGENKPVPSRLRLSQDVWDDTVGFINDVRTELSRMSFPPRYVRRMQQSQVKRVQSYWDFSTIREISVPAALMLASEYDRVGELNGLVPKAVNIDSWDPRVRHLLDAIGFLDLAGVEDRKTTTTELSDGRLLRLRRGNSADGQAVADYFRALGIDLTTEDPRLNDAIMEAITNTVHHAYRDKGLCEPLRVKAWWIAAWLRNESDRRKLTLAVYDQGASIPRTLPTWEKYPTLKRMLLRALPWVGPNPDPKDTRYDGEAIRLAIQVGRTSTSESNRGKGLHQIVQALELSRGGSVHIFSRCGVWRQNAGEPAQSETYRTPMVGTMVIWKLEL